MSDKTSDEDLLNELRRLKEFLGRNPKQKDLVLGKYSCNAYKRAFNGFSKALILIGEKPTFYKNLTKEDLIDEVKRIYEETGEIPTYTLFAEKAKLTYNTARNIIGNMPWHLFLKECNLFTENQIETVKRGTISIDELKNEVLRLKEKYGRCPTYTDMLMDGKINPDVYAFKFGTYTKAMQELGFEDHLPRGSYKNSTPIKGKDGIIYKSIFEANVAHYLLDLKNNNLIKDYEYERIVFKKDCWRWTCDFVITFLDGKELYLECDGMLEKRKYPYNKDNPKIQYYIDNNMNYAILEYSREIYDDLSKLLNLTLPCQESLT